MDSNEMDKRIESLFEEWKTLQPLAKKDQERFDKKVRLDWNYHSNRIEGNTLTYGETELLLFFGRMEGGHLERNYVEMKAHDVAIQTVQGWVKDDTRPLAENDIRDLNKILLKEPFTKITQTPDGKETQKKIIPGEYKKQPNHVQTASGEIFKFAEPAEVPAKMEAFTKWLCEELEQPTLAASDLLAKLHHDFILIHPFDDGNGRVVRLLLNYALLKLGYPPMVIESSDRDNYFTQLEKADGGDIEPLAVYLGNSLIAWLEISIKAARGEDIKEADEVDKVVELFIKSKEHATAIPKRDAVALSNADRADLLYEAFFKIFIDSFQEKFDPFKVLFESVSIRCYYDMDNDLVNFHELSSYFKSAIESADYLVIIEFTYHDYKYAEELYEINFRLRIGLSELSYSVDIDIYSEPSSALYYSDSVTKRYKQIWTEEEIDNWLRESKKAMLSGLKEIEAQETEEKENHG